MGTLSQSLVLVFGLKFLAGNRYFSQTITTPYYPSVVDPNTLHRHLLDNCSQSRAYIESQKSNFVPFLVNELEFFSLGHCSNNVRPWWLDTHTGTRRWFARPNEFMHGRCILGMDTGQTNHGTCFFSTSSPVVEFEARLPLKYVRFIFIL